MKIFFFTKQFLARIRDRIKIRFNILTIKIPLTAQIGDFLVTTKAALYHLQGKNCSKIGYGEFFGITSNNLDKIWVFEAFTNVQTGRLIEFQKNNTSGNWQGRVRLKNLSRGIHQLYFADGYVFLMDTYHNAIAKFCPDQSTIIESFFPFGKLKNGRESENYKHMNSIIKKGGEFNVMCHNETLKTGQKSEIARLDDGMQICGMLMTDASCGHDIQIHEDELVFLDSLGGRIIRGNKVIVRRESFLKGLAIVGEIITYGENKHSSRGDRFNTCSEIVRFNVKKEQEIDRVRTKGVIQQITII